MDTELPHDDSPAVVTAPRLPTRPPGAHRAARPVMPTVTQATRRQRILFALPGALTAIAAGFTITAAALYLVAPAAAIAMLVLAAVTGVTGLCLYPPVRFQRREFERIQLEMERRWWAAAKNIALDD